MILYDNILFWIPVCAGMTEDFIALKWREKCFINRYTKS